MSNKLHEDEKELHGADEKILTPDGRGTPWEKIKLSESLGYFDNLSASFKGFVSALIALLKAILFIHSYDYATDIVWPETRHLYVVTEDGDIYISKDMGLSFDKVIIGLVNENISMIAGGEQI